AGARGYRRNGRAVRGRDAVEDDVDQIARIRERHDLAERQRDAVGREAFSGRLVADRAGADIETAVFVRGAGARADRPCRRVRWTLLLLPQARQQFLGMLA